jgi:hypothetical protein
VTGAATNNFAATVRNRGTDGLGAVQVAITTYAAGVNAVAYDENTLALSGTAANLLVNEGDNLTCEKLVNGTGLAMPDGHVVVLLAAR